MPSRIRRSRAKGWRLPEGTVIVDRSTKWGNPFVVGLHGTRADCVRYYDYLLGGLFCISVPNGPSIAEQQDCLDHVMRNIPKLRGHDLACWCALPAEGQPDLCHGALLLQLCAKLDAKEKDLGRRLRRSDWSKRAARRKPDA